MEKETSEGWDFIAEEGRSNAFTQHQHHQELPRRSMHPVETRGRMKSGDEKKNGEAGGRGGYRES